MPSTATVSETAEEMVGNEESLEEVRNFTESQDSGFEAFMQRMGYDVSSLLENACPVLVENPNKRYGPKATSTPEHSITNEHDWSISTLSDSEETYKEGRCLETCTLDEEDNYLEPTCTWETLESTRTKSSKPTSISSATGPEYSSVPLKHSREKSQMYSYGTMDPLETTMDEEQTCNKRISNDSSKTVLKTPLPITQQKPEVAKSLIFEQNLDPFVHLERLESGEIEKYMHPKKRLPTKRQSKLNAAQSGLHTDENSEQSKENSQTSAHSKHEVTEIQVSPKIQDNTFVKESIGVPMNKKSVENKHQQKYVPCEGNSISSTNSSTIRTNTTGQKQPHKRIFTSMDFLTPFQKKNSQEKNADSKPSTQNMNCCPVKKRKVSSSKENITNNEVTEQRIPSSNESANKNLLVPKNKKQLVFPKQLKMLQNKNKLRVCTINDSITDSSKKELISKIYKPRVTQSSGSKVLKPKKAAIVQRAAVSASVEETETDVPSNAIDIAADLPENMKPGENQSTSVLSQVVENDILAKSSRGKKRYRIVYLGPSVIRRYQNATPDMLGEKVRGTRLNEESKDQSESTIDLVSHKLLQ